MTHKVVVIGGGFGGLYAAKALGKLNKAVVTLIDRRNFHLFQPLLYQVATGGLSPGDIASPLRAVLSRYENTRVIHGNVIDLDPDRNQVILAEEILSYDSLIVATGAIHHYFGNDNWAKNAPGLKSVEEALEIRRRIFLAFETAERTESETEREAWLNFVVVGGGPTGVELAGALGELAHFTLKNDFRIVDPKQSKIYLVEGAERILTVYPAQLAQKAQRALEHLGVTILTQTMVTDISDRSVTLLYNNHTRLIPTKTVLWGAGVKASPLGYILKEKAGAELDRMGRVIVQPDLSLPNRPNIFVIGDLAHFSHNLDQPLPGVAQVAMQQGNYAARLIRKQVQDQGRPTKPFRYVDKGSLAVIGRNQAVADLNFLRLAGFPAWLIWVFVHIAYLIEYDNRLMVMLQWAWSYFTRNRGARLITGDPPYPVMGN